MDGYGGKLHTTGLSLLTGIANIGHPMAPHGMSLSGGAKILRNIFQWKANPDELDVKLGTMGRWADGPLAIL